MKYIKENNMHCDLYRKFYNYCFLNKALTVTTNIYFKGFFYINLKIRETETETDKSSMH